MNSTFNGGHTGDRAMRVKVAFGAYSVGAVFYPPAAFREWLMRRGFIEDADAPRIDQAQEHMTAELPIVKRGRGRPRKNGG